MRHRRKLGRRSSESMFTRHAMRVHPKNVAVLTGAFGPMRGGIRL